MCSYDVDKAIKKHQGSVLIQNSFFVVLLCSRFYSLFFLFLLSFFSFPSFSSSCLCASRVDISPHNLTLHNTTPHNTTIVTGDREWSTQHSPPPSSLKEFLRMQQKKACHGCPAILGEERVCTSVCVCVCVCVCESLISFFTLHLSSSVCLCLCLFLSRLGALQPLWSYLLLQVPYQQEGVHHRGTQEHAGSHHPLSR
jgi:hypothetical protein